MDREHVVFFHDQVLDAIELDLLAGVLAEQDGVAGLDVERHALAVLVGLAEARREHLALLRFFLRGIGNDDRARALLRFLEALNDDPVVERSDIHGWPC